jgi:hypothetical protein
MDYDKYIHLHREHERLKWTYRAAVDLLFDLGFRATENEYLKLKASVDSARYNLEFARQKLERCKRNEERAAGASAAGYLIANG